MSTLVYHGPARRLPVLSVRWLGERPRGDCATRAPKILEAGYRAGVKPGNAGRRFPPEPLTTDEVLRLIAACPNGKVGTRNRALIALLWRTGLRRRGDRGRLRSGEGLLAVSDASRASTFDHGAFAFSCRSGRQRQGMFTQRIPLEERFWRYLTPGQSDECWEWQGSRDKHGYGRIQRGGRNGGIVKAHRASWELANGPIPDGLVICHRCDNPPCCNPAHLFPGTQLVNQRDMSAKGRSGARFGNENGKTLIPDETVVRIRELAAAGVPYKVLAERFAVTPNWVSGVVTGDRRSTAGGPIAAKQNRGPRPKVAA